MTDAEAAPLEQLVNKLRGVREQAFALPALLALAGRRARPRLHHSQTVIKP